MEDSGLNEPEGEGAKGELAAKDEPAAKAAEAQYNVFSNERKVALSLRPRARRRSTWIGRLRSW